MEHLVRTGLITRVTNEPWSVFESDLRPGLKDVKYGIQWTKAGLCCDTWGLPLAVTRLRIAPGRSQPVKPQQTN